MIRRDYFEDSLGCIIKVLIEVFVVVILLFLILKIATIPEFTQLLNPAAIILTSIPIIIATATFYLTHIKGADITFKVNKNIVFEPSDPTDSIIIPALFINEGGKPGTLIRDSEWDDPWVEPPKFLKDFGSRAEIKFDTDEYDIKLAPGESITCKINISLGHVDDIRKVNDKIKELNNLFKKHKESKFTVGFAATTKKGIEHKKKDFKVKIKMRENK